MSIDFDQLTSGVTGAPATWGSQCCKVALPAAAEYAEAALTSLPKSYTRYETILESETLPDNGERRLFWTRSVAAGHNIIEADLRQLVGGALVIRFRVTHSGTPAAKTIYTDTTSLAFGTVYRLEFKWDINAGEWEIRRDSSTLFSGSITGAPATSGLDIINIGSTGAGDGNVTYYLDNIAVAVDDWVGGEAPPPPPGGYDIVKLAAAQRVAIISM